MKVTTKPTWQVMKDAADVDGVYGLGLRYLMMKTNRSIATVARHLAELIDAGWIERVERGKFARYSIRD